MYSIIHKVDESFANRHLVILGATDSDWSKFDLSSKELDFVRSELAKNQLSIQINQYSRNVFIECFNEQKTKSKTLEKARERGASLTKKCNAAKIEAVELLTASDVDVSLHVAEGMALANYQFLKYFTDADKKRNSLKAIYVQADQKAIRQINAVVSGTLHARDLVNEPLSYLTAIQFSNDMVALGEASGFKVEVLHKKQIETLKMGGLLAVNQGALEPPTFNVLTYKPENASNTKPIVLVGKGIVYDTGGLSLKPTANSMDIMKCDMGGGASVVGILYAIAKAELPVYVVGLIPATENRPGGNAYAPGDVIRMMDNTSVEVLNTDAEGRLVLADALCYAKKYNPQLVIDFATLTGAAVRAIGKYGIVAMGTADAKVQRELTKSGELTCERLAMMPFWDEYADLLKSHIADMTNLGPAEAGHITAGKFLEHFTDYPWMHFDIAGPAFLSSDDHYRLKGGTGSGVRILFDYLLRLTSRDQ